VSSVKKEKLSPSNNKNEKPMDHCIDFHGAAFINQDGEEIAITEEMVEKACDQLIKDKTNTL